MMRATQRCGWNRRNLAWMVLAIALCLSPPGMRAAVEGIPCTPEPTDMTIGYGSLVICDIDPAGDVDVFRFSGAAGESVTIVGHRRTGPGEPCVELFDPQGSQVGTHCTYERAHVNAVLQKTGVYTIRISEWVGNGNVTLAYALSLERVGSPPSPSATLLRFAQGLGDEINPIGDVDLFYFSGIAGDTVTVAAAYLAGQGEPCVELYDPAGTLIGGICDYDQARVDKLLQATGLFTIRVSDWIGNGNATVGYRVDLQCVGQCPSLPRPAISVTLTGCTVCQPGQTFSARVTINNAGVPPLPAELKVGFYPPDGTPMNLGDPHLELPGNFTFEGEIARGSITAAHAQGTWRFCARLLELQLGEARSASCQSFTLGP